MDLSEDRLKNEIKKSVDIDQNIYQKSFKVINGNPSNSPLFRYMSGNQVFFEIWVSACL